VGLNFGSSSISLQSRIGKWRHPPPTQHLEAEVKSLPPCQQSATPASNGAVKIKVSDF
jgi:hypothetical protein